jgi:hypothetical protein
VSDLKTRIYNSVAENGESAWDALSAGRPFQSARWYEYSERVMQDCQPIYIVLSRNDQAVARGTFWVVRQEPLPVPPTVNSWLKPILTRWPLMICRSPLSNSSGLILPEPPLRDAALKQIAEEAVKEAKRYRCSFLLFVFLAEADTHFPGWPRGFADMTGGDPGTRMNVEWDSFDAYLESRDKKNQRRFAYNTKKAIELSVDVTRHSSALNNIEESLVLIHSVEDKYRSPHNPWIRGMLENMQMVESTFLEAHIGSQLVGCELILYDNKTQVPTALGHVEAASYAYLEMLYTNLRDAMERKCRLLRWGSGSYDIKRHLGFELEYNNHMVFFGLNSLFWLVARMATLFRR